MTTDKRLDGFICEANAEVLGRMLDIYTVNTLVTFLIDLEVKRLAESKRAGVNCPGFPHVKGVPCPHCGISETVDNDERGYDIERAQGGAAYNDLMGFNDGPPEPPEPGDYDCPVTGMGRADEPTIEQAAAKADAFDFSRATNLYLLAARDLGTCLGGHSITDLLADRTDWDLDKCKRLGDRVVDDQAIKDLLAFEQIPEAYENG